MITIIIFYLFGIWIVSMLLYLFIPHEIFSVFFLGLCSVVFISIVYKLLSQKIEISDQGVKYKTPFTCYELKWHEIKIIGIANFNFLVSKHPWLYFSEQERYLDSLSRMKNVSGFLMMNYRKCIITEIKKYWQGEIFFSD